MRTHARSALLATSLLCLPILQATAHAQATCSTNADCNDSNVCTVDFCDSATGCVHIPTVNNPCQPDRCRTVGQCHASVCQNTAPLVCPNDGNECTLDCDPASGCTHASNCDDQDGCTADFCSPELGCYHLHSCDDGDPCTVDQCVPAGCSHLPAECGDGIDLTVTKGPFNASITLSYWGGGAPFRIYRSGSPVGLMDLANSPGISGDNSWTDAQPGLPPAGGVSYYLVGHDSP